MSVKVSVVKCPSYEEQTVFQKVKETIDLLGGMERFVSAGQIVLLKPNLLVGRAPEKCVTTHPAVVRAVALLVKEAGATPLIGDGPQLDAANKVADNCGIGDVARELGIEIVEFEPESVHNSEGKVFKNFTIGKVIKEVDRIINIAKFKTHSLTFFTLSVKNMFGSVPGLKKAQWHLKTYHAGKAYFAYMLLDLYLLTRPVLNIVDGVMAMEGKGPGGGDPRHLGLFIAGADGVAVDRVCAEIVDVEPERVPLLKVALKAGYGTADMQKIAVVGERLDDVRITDFKLPPEGAILDRIPRVIPRFLKTYLSTHPVINQKQCRQCEKCMEACPMKTIVKRGAHMCIQKDNCIQCLCCMEICPHEAVDLMPSRLLAIYNRLRGIPGKA